MMSCLCVTRRKLCSEGGRREETLGFRSSDPTNAYNSFYLHLMHLNNQTLSINLLIAVDLMPIVLYITSDVEVNHSLLVRMPLLTLICATLC